MRLGTLLHELWRHPRWLGLCAAVALVAAVGSVFRIGLLPPSLSPRSLTIGTAATHVLVDTPRSKIVDLNANTNDFLSLTTRADLLGNVMASLPVRANIARIVGVGADEIQATAPITASIPRAVIEPGSGQSATDIAAAPDRYKLQIQADPTVPILHVYAQAPSAAAAGRLANASVRGLREYLALIAARQGVAPRDQVRLQQFGAATGRVANDGFGPQLAVLTFVVVFVVACGAVLVGLRVRRGWAMGEAGAASSPPVSS